MSIIISRIAWLTYNAYRLISMRKIDSNCLLHHSVVATISFIFTNRRTDAVQYERQVE